MVRMLTPATFNGKTHGEALVYLARTWSFFDNPPMGFTPELKFMTLLNLLAEDAAVWAIQFYLRLGASPPPWSTFDFSEHNFKVHVCPVDDAAAAFEKLKNWGCGVSHPRMMNLQEWTAKFNALVACTMLSNEDKGMHYCDALPHDLRRQLAVTSGDVSTIVKMQTVVLCMAQSLAAINATQSQPWRTKGKGKQTPCTDAALPGNTKPPATTTPRQETCTCHVHGKVGHLACNCLTNHVAAAHVGNLEDHIQAL